MSKKANEKRNEMNAIEKEMKEMSAQAETQENVVMETEPETTTTEELETITAQAEPENTAEPELTKEEKRQKTIEMINAKLRLYPHTLTIKELILFRVYAVEEWLETQRTPSHTKATAEQIIDSALQGISVGVITLGHNTDTDGVSIVNGSSRVDDFINYYTGKIGRKESMYKDLSEEKQKKFLAMKVTIDWLQGNTAELTRDFLNLNNATNLTGGQKALGKLVNSSALNIVKELKHHDIFTGMFSARQLQKEEANNVIFLTLANIKGCYASSISKLTESLAEKDCSDIDIDKIRTIFDMLQSANVELNKFKLVHATHLLYIGDCWQSKQKHIKFELSDIDTNAINAMVTVNYQTAGTNSADVNEKRINEMSKKLYGQLASTQAQADNKQASEPTLDPDTLV